MKMNICYLITAITLFFQYVHGDDSNIIHHCDEVTYEWLIETGVRTSYTDHIPHFRLLFETMKVRTLLEFGLGFSTKYFLDHCDQVVSVEFVTPGSGPEWLIFCQNFYKPISNWIPVSYFTGLEPDLSWSIYPHHGTRRVYDAGSYQCATHQDYSLIDDAYQHELDAFILSFTNSGNVDAAFVDSGIYIRGDLVQLLFNKVPVILAHDTTERMRNIQNDVYGYSRIKTPSNYEELFIPHGAGTTIWIEKRDDLQPLINAMQTYIAEMPNRSF